jgi:hypothetical protein
MAQVVQAQALSSNPSTTKKIPKNQKTIVRKNKLWAVITDYGLSHLQRNMQEHSFDMQDFFFLE